MQKRNVEALASPDDCELAETIAKADAGVQALLRERNITRLDLVACDPWSGRQTADIVLIQRQRVLGITFPMLESCTQCFAFWVALTEPCGDCSERHPERPEACHTALHVRAEPP